ncbi:DMT family transporter [Oceanobacter kriegii]|uniref:DMT family transporter n=1 Tax=Oceanobacter kriegii TaxID=64972 RepID=UPI000425B03C|nr:DMT family transporter [Oceanobacter kriegii]
MNTATARTESKDSENTGSDTSTANSDQRFGLLLALCAATLFSTKPIIIKWLYAEGVDTLPLMWLRLSIALPFYLVIGWLAFRKRTVPVTVAAVVKAMAVGLLGYYLASLLDLLGLQYVSAQLERLVLYAYPSIVVVLGIVLFGKAFNKAIVLPLLLTYAGLLFMYGNDLTMLSASSEQAAFASDSNELLIGSLLVLGSALSFAFYLVYSKPCIQQLGSVLFTSIAMTSATFATLIHNSVSGWITGEPMVLLPDYSLDVWLGIIGLAVFATVVPSFLVSTAIGRIGPEKTSMSGTLGPVATTLMAVWLLDEPMSLFSVAGMALVVFGVWRLSKVK